MKSTWCSPLVGIETYSNIPSAIKTARIIKCNRVIITTPLSNMHTDLYRAGAAFSFERFSVYCTRISIYFPITSTTVAKWNLARVNSCTKRWKRAAGSSVAASEQSSGCIRRSCSCCAAPDRAARQKGARRRAFRGRAFIPLIWILNWGPCAPPPPPRAPAPDS